MAQTNATTTGTAQAADRGSAQFPPFDAKTYPGQLVWLALTFGFLYFMMSRVIAPRLAKILGDRRARIAKDLAEAAAMKAKADEAGAAYEKALGDARAKAQGIAQETRATLAAESDQRRKALEADLATKLAEAEALIRTSTDSAMANVREIAGDAAGAIVERLTGRAPDRAALDAAYGRVQA